MGFTEQCTNTLDTLARALDNDPGRVGAIKHDLLAIKAGDPGSPARTVVLEVEQVWK